MNRLEVLTHMMVTCFNTISILEMCSKLRTKLSSNVVMLHSLKNFWIQLQRIFQKVAGIYNKMKEIRRRLLDHYHGQDFNSFTS